MPSPPLVTPSVTSFDGDGAVGRSIRGLEAGFAAHMVLVGLAVVASGALARRGVDDWGLARAAFGGAAAAGCLGLALMRKVAYLPRLTVSDLLTGVAKRLGLQPRLSPHRFAAGARTGLQEKLAAAVTGRLRALNTDISVQPSPYESDMQRSRANARVLTTELYRDAEAIAAALQRIGASSTRVECDTRSAVNAHSSLKHHLVELAEDAGKLTIVIDAATADIRRASAAIGTLADQNAYLQKCIHTLDDGTPEIMLALDTIKTALAGLGALGRQASMEAVQNGQAAHNEARLAAGIQSVFATILSLTQRIESRMDATAGQIETWRGIAQGILENTQRLIEAQTGMEMLLERQSDVLALAMKTLTGAQADIDHMGTHLAEVARHSTAHASDADALQRTAMRLPGHADTVSALLSQVSDFFQPQVFDF